MKKAVALIATFIIFGLMAFTLMQGGAYQGGEASKGIGDFKDFDKKEKEKQVAKIAKAPQNENIEQDKLKALRDKAGNRATFEISDDYRRKCASCHGVDGSGMQNGKKMMGPSLIGQTQEKLYKNLIDFKAGRKENLIMKGLLLNLSDEDLKSFAEEIGQFKSRKENQAK